MNEHMLEELGELARQAPAPNVDVSFRVMPQIKEARVPVDRPMAVLAGLSAAAAAIVLAYAVQTWSTWQDPIAGLLSSMETVLQ
jgi:hypothetical protein